MRSKNLLSTPRDWRPSLSELPFNEIEPEDASKLDDVF